MQIFGTHDDKTLAQINQVAEKAVKVALMADGHLGYVMPIGGVAAYLDMVSVVGVGFDIACGNCAIKTDAKLSDMGKSPEKLNFMLSKLADDIQAHISFGVGRSNLAKDAPTDHPLFDSDDWNRIRERAGYGEYRKLKDRARDQLGTVGSGNHYVDVFVDEEGHLWVGVHFGSRGFGHGVASGFMALAQGADWGDRVPEQETLLSIHSSLGQDYWALMSLAGEYAYAGREWVARKVVELIGAKEVEMVHNHHNFAWKETHWVDSFQDHTDVIVVRKGATPAFPGQKGFVGGSMGDISVILEGRDADTSAHEHEWRAILSTQIEAMYSTVHGAGRVMSRTEATGKRNRKTGELKLDEHGNPVKPPRVTKEMMTEWLSKTGVILRGGGVDESPHVYRRLPDVLRDQLGTVTVLHELKPLIVVMAGEDTYDPYKD